VVDELIERKAVTKDIKAIGNISDIPVQHRVMEFSLSFARLSGISLGTITLSTTCASPINVLKNYTPTHQTVLIERQVFSRVWVTTRIL
jgi:hypothetical protein